MDQNAYKATNIEGTPTPTPNSGGMANKRTLRGSDFIVRFLAVVATLVALIVMGVSKQTETVAVSVVPTLPPFNVSMNAKWQYSSAFIFFMVANIIACIYGALTLILAIGSRFRSKGLDLTVIVLDLVMLALLFAGNGAAGAVGIIGYKGNSHTRWNKVCNVFDSYCRHIAGSIAVSLIGALMFLILLVLTISRLHKRSH